MIYPVGYQEFESFAALSPFKRRQDTHRGPMNTSQRYSVLELLCVVANKADNVRLSIPVRTSVILSGALNIETEATGGFTPTSGYNTVDLQAAATDAAMATAVAGALAAAGEADVFSSTGKRGFASVSSDGAYVYLFARDPFLRLQGPTKIGDGAGASASIVVNGWGIFHDSTDGRRLAKMGGLRHRRFIHQARKQRQPT